jgi:probable phosphoglycerate mutase
MAMNATEKWKRPARRRVYLMRHGEVSYFDAQRRPYRPDTVPLNEEGRQQAESAGRLLAEIPFDRVVTSDLVRSVETARLVIADRNLSIEQRPQLREIQPGRLADIPTDAVEHAFLGAFSGSLEPDMRFLAGETYGSLIDRVRACFAELFADNQWRHLLIVAHGGVNRTILAHALGLDLRVFGVIEQDAGCINILDGDEAGRFLVRLLNYTPYNPAKTGMNLTTMERLFLQYRGNE